MRKSWVRLAALVGVSILGCTCGMAAEGRKAGPAPAVKAVPVVVLDTTSFWRFRIVWETVEVVRESGKVEHVRFTYDGNWFRKHPGALEVAAGDYTVEPVEAVRLPADTSRDWMQSAFDDSTWARCRGPMLDKSTNVNWKLVLARGRFEVTDPARAGDLTLSVRFRGGLVVYLNGRELTRAFMPKGPINPHTPAEPYPEEVYLDDNGYLVWPHDDKMVYLDRYKKRIRRLKGFHIPASQLKKGVNVLGLAIHRSPAPQMLYLRRIKRYPHGDERMHWCKTGLVDVGLTARPGAAVVSNTGRLAGRGFLVSNHGIIRRVRIPDYSDPFAPLAPIRLTGVRNGTFGGQVVVSDDAPIRGLTAAATALSGPGTLPASAIRIRYPLPDGEPPKRGEIGPFDSLEESPPAEVPVYEAHGGAVQPIWVSVRVPADAKPGDYTGTVTIRADGVEPVAVPLHVRVIDWTLPDPKAFTPRMDIVQSPESVAMAYGVPLWSDEHMRLLDKTFSLLAPLSARTLYITCVRRTHFGNKHAMVRWVRGADGELEPDFSIVEKYLDVATKHLGRVPGVILYCWEPADSMGHAGGGASRTHDRPILITLVSARTGTLRNMKGPAWGTPESKAFWTKLVTGMKQVLAKRGLADSMLFGLIGDHRPTSQAMADVSAGAPETKWAVHSHHYCDTWQGRAIGMCSALWGIHIRPEDPSVRRAYGWQNPFWLVYYPREMSLYTSLVEHRTKLENWLGASSGYHKKRTAQGLGRIGADFWKVLGARGRRKSLAGRYPESYWGQLNLNYCISHLLGRGKDGPVATVRSEAFRENIQEIEARIFIEKALLDETKRATLGEALAGRCRAAIDERIRMCLHSGGEGRPWFIGSDWNARTETLFRLTAEVAERLER